jgi:hypothetical protein
MGKRNSDGTVTKAPGSARKGGTKSSVKAVGTKVGWPSTDTRLVDNNPGRTAAK